MFMRSGYRAQTRSVGFACAFGTRSGTQHHDRAADVLLGAPYRAGRFDPKPGGSPLALQLRAPQLCQDGLVAFARELDRSRLVRLPNATGVLARAQDAPLALDHDLFLARLHANR